MKKIFTQAININKVSAAIENKNINNYGQESIWDYRDEIHSWINECSKTWREEKEEMELTINDNYVRIEAPGSGSDLSNDSADIPNSKNWDIVITVDGKIRVIDMRAAVLCNGFLVYIANEYLTDDIIETIEEMLDEMKGA